MFFDIEALSDHTSPLPHMLPRPETFAVAMRELGVNQDKHLIVYDEGNLFSAPRAWWMLRTFGVEKVSILGGGLAGWQRDDLLLEEGAVELPEGEFNAAFNPGVEFYSWVTRKANQCFISRLDAFTSPKPQAFRVCRMVR